MITFGIGVKTFNYVQFGVYAKSWHLILAGWLLASAWLLGRGLFYGLLNANVAWGTDVYLRPVLPLVILVLVLDTAWRSGLVHKGIRMIREAKRSVGHG